jgi:hypothetical protein
MRQFLAKDMVITNGARMRKDNDKPGPFGMSRNEALSLPEKWSGRDHLLEIEYLTIIRELKEVVGGEDLLAFMSKEFSSRAQGLYDTAFASKSLQ